MQNNASLGFYDPLQNTQTGVNPNWAANLGQVEPGAQDRSKGFLEQFGPMALTLGGLGYAAARPKKEFDKSRAYQLVQQGQQLMDPLMKGTPLPRGAEAMVQKQQTGSEAAIKSQFASAGLAGSSMEKQALQQAALDADMARFSIAANFYGQGVKEFLQGDQMLANFVAQEIYQDQQFVRALSGFAQMFAEQDFGQTMQSFADYVGKGIDWVSDLFA